MRVLIRMILASSLAGGTLAGEGGDALLQLSKTIPLPKVEGRVDHMAIDLKGQRLFVAALGNNSVEVIDLVKGERVHTISGLDEPQGAVFLPETNQILIANGGDGSCRGYDGVTYALTKSIDLKSDADNARLDAAGNTIYVGFGSGALAAIDAKTLERTGEARLSQHPESFQLEQNGSRIFVNVPHSKRIEVIDRKKMTLVAQWTVSGAANNFPMAVDVAAHRLFAGCRSPARVLVFDTESGKEVTAFDCVGDADEVFFDPRAKYLYVVGGEGRVDVFTQLDADHYQLAETVKTSAGARTGLLSPDLKILFVAVPHRGNDHAEIRCFTVK